MELGSQPPLFTWQVSENTAQDMHAYPVSNVTLDWRYLPLQATFELFPVFVYPVLQWHPAAFVVGSCEHAAFESHPPLLTRHVSIENKSNTFCTLGSANQISMCVPVQVTFGAEPVLVYPVLQLQTTALLVGSCEQIALVSQPPFATWQVSTTKQPRSGSYSLSSMIREGRGDEPVQTTLETLPVLVYPVLQAHKTALLKVSWEQLALGSHPPLFTWQASTNSKQRKYQA